MARPPHGNKPSSRGALDEADAQIRQQRGDLSGVCPIALLGYNSLQKSKNETGDRAICSASFAAWLMTWSISGKVLSNVVAGFS